jgi:hypothetical protein
MQQSMTSAQRPSPYPLGETTSHSTRLQETAAKSLVIPPAGEGIGAASFIHQLNEETAELRS